MSVKWEWNVESVTSFAFWVTHLSLTSSQSFSHCSFMIIDLPHWTWAGVSMYLLPSPTPRLAETLSFL